MYINWHGQGSLGTLNRVNMALQITFFRNHEVLDISIIGCFTACGKPNLYPSLSPLETSWDWIALLLKSNEKPADWQPIPNQQAYF